MAFRTMNAMSACHARGGMVMRRRATRWRSPIHLAEDGVHGAHDCHDVRDLVPRNDVRQHGEIRERRTPPLHTVGLGAAVADQVATDLAPGEVGCSLVSDGGPKPYRMK